MLSTSPSPAANDWATGKKGGARISKHSLNDVRNGLQMKGKVLAKILAAEWNPNLSISAEELAQVAPMILNLGGAAWAWRQIRQTDLKETSAAQELHQAYRMHTLHVAIKEQEI